MRLKKRQEEIPGMKNIAFLLTKCIAAVSFLSAVAFSLWPCAFLFHQPQEPEELKAMRGF